MKKPNNVELQAIKNVCDAVMEGRPWLVMTDGDDHHATVITSLKDRRKAVEWLRFVADETETP